ncbi:LCP family protein [Camelliibacillus cellulosilyticus]|uniref:LCP family protein n=1 Tax=Camelliibacillus cellulosilyticus TaxID=2174486 RepID=A0ABV9GP26_9BACL
MKNRKLKRTLWIVGLIVGLFFVSVLGYGYYIYHSIKDTARDVYKPLTEEKSKPTPLREKMRESSKSKAINILLLGVDQRKGDKGRSDTMIVATLNPGKSSMLMTSIPRDTRVHIDGHEGYSKINAAYAYGNEALAVKTVEDYLNIPIDYYIKMNMEGLSSLVDAVGGVTVHNHLAWYDGTLKFDFKKGTLHLNGQQALSYARERHRDPRGDFGRNDRQREVIQAMIESGKRLTTLTKMTDILSAVGHNVQTNLSFDDMKFLVANYRQCRQNIENYEVKGNPKYLDKVSWVLVSEEERKNVHDLISKALSD